jgi:DNA polymerase III sliding clamp (beta) subunit (PCNA family)
MKVVNRSFITIYPTQLFWNWANKHSDDVAFDEEDDTEGTVYLIEEDFFDFEPVLEKNFKKIFRNELSSIVEDEELWPEDRTMDVFLSWFKIDFGSIVIDLDKSNLKSE